MNLSTSDKDGYVPDTAIIGRLYRHSGNGHTYEIIGFVFLGDTDQWAVLHCRVDCDVTFSRTVENFFGLRNGKPRYELAGV